MIHRFTDGNLSLLPEEEWEALLPNVATGWGLEDEVFQKHGWTPVHSVFGNGLFEKVTVCRRRDEYLISVEGGITGWLVHTPTLADMLVFYERRVAPMLCSPNREQLMALPPGWVVQAKDGSRCRAIAVISDLETRQILGEDGHRYPVRLLWHGISVDVDINGCVDVSLGDHLDVELIKS